MRRLPITRGIVVCSLFLALLTIGLDAKNANFAQAATFTVTKTADMNDGACDADCSLREAIISANAAPGTDVITLPAGTYILSIPGTDEYEAATGDLDISDDLTINGAGSSTTIIDGGGLDRIFSPNNYLQSNASVAFQDVTIQNGFAYSGGGIAILSGTDVRLDRVVFKDNTSISGAGAIFNVGTLSVRNCTFSGNKATGSGLPGGAIWNQGTLTVESSTFENNDALLGLGGAILTTGNASVNIENSTFTSNGWPALWVGTGTVTVNNCTFASNVGGVFGSSSSLTISNTIIADRAPEPNCSGTFTSGGHNLSMDDLRDADTCWFRAYHPA